MTVVFTLGDTLEYNKIIGDFIDAAWFQKGAVRKQMYDLGDKIQRAGIPSPKDIVCMIDLGNRMEGDLSKKKVLIGAGRLWDMLDYESLFPEPTEADYEMACMMDMRRRGVQ